MIGLRKILLSGAAILALTGMAQAADIPVRGPVYSKAPAPAWSWEGQYIGVHAGYLWGSNEISNAGAFGELSPTGGLGGFQIGYNHHISRNWIVGYEIDVSFAGADDAGVIGGAITNDVKAFGTARTRIGYANGPWLLYGTGGFAWATTNVAPPFSSLDRAHTGYALGAGVEYAFAPNWSAKLEYLYADLGDTNTNLFGAVVTTDLTVSTVRLGLNYRFANWRAPVAGAYPVKAPVQTAGWTGPYIGVHGGYAWGSFDTVSIGVAGSLEPSGGIFGIQSGYNWQLSRNWVVGVESDSSWGRVRDAVGITNVDFDAAGTVRARLGYAMNNVLIYGTGGLAWAHADSTTFSAARDQFYLGWAAGAGIEYALSSRWSAKVEYLYADFGNTNDTLLGSFSVAADVHTVRVGLNYRASLFGLLFDR